MSITTRTGIEERQCVAINGFSARGVFVGHASKVGSRWSVYDRGTFEKCKTREAAEVKLRSMGAVEIREAAWF